ALVRRQPALRLRRAVVVFGGLCAGEGLVDAGELLRQQLLPALQHAVERAVGVVVAAEEAEGLDEAEAVALGLGVGREGGLEEGERLGGAPPAEVDAREVELRLPRHARDLLRPLPLPGLDVAELDELAHGLLLRPRVGAGAGGVAAVVAL